MWLFDGSFNEFIEKISLKTDMLNVLSLVIIGIGVFIFNFFEEKP